LALGLIALFGGAPALAWPDTAGLTPASGLAGQPQVTDDDIHRLEVYVGTSTVVQAPWQVTRVSITTPGVADVQVLTPKQVLVTGNALGSTDLIMWGEQEDQVWHARITVQIDLSFIKIELAKLFPNSELDVTQSQDMVVISGRHRRVEDVTHLRAVMESYGIKYVDTTSVAGVQQVMIHVRVAEASRNAVRELGVNLVYRGDNTQWATLPKSDGGGPLVTPTLIDQVRQFATSTTLIGNINGIDLQMFLQALAENQYARILAEPNLTALSGEEATFLAGGEFPIPVVQGGGGTENNASITIEYKEFGVHLRFKPIVLGDNSIRMLVAPEVSELSDVGSVEIQGFRVPSILTRRAETTLEMKSGQSFAIAGLLNDELNARNSRIPLLGDLPILGTLFRSVRYQKRETELLVLVTATLVEPLNDVRSGMVPGETHVTPSDWELYIEGRIDGKTTPLSPVDAQWLKDKGLNRLSGPGAWSTHETPPAVGQADYAPVDNQPTSNPSETPANP
jgi:pilus assembly protein CpaC